MKRSEVESWLRAATSGKGTMGSVHEDLFIMPQKELAQLCEELLALMPEDRRSGSGRRDYDPFSGSSHLCRGRTRGARSAESGPRPEASIVKTAVLCPTCRSVTADPRHEGLERRLEAAKQAHISEFRAEWDAHIDGELYPMCAALWGQE